MVFKRRDKPTILARLREALMPRRGWRRGIEYLGHRMRRLPDTPHRIALGFASGVFVCFTPFFGLQFFLAMGLAWMVRGNVVASLFGTAVGNPLTFPVIGSISLGLGRRILGHGASGRDPSRVWDALAQFPSGIWRSVLSLFGGGEAEWGKLTAVIVDVIWPYCVGGFLPGLLAAVASYLLVRPLVAAYQARRRARMLERASARVVGRKSPADGGGPPAYNEHGATGDGDGR